MTLEIQTAELSPADQIMIAVAHVYQAHGDDPPIEAVAAAVLAAAADQVVPEEADLPPLPPTHEMIENPLDSLEYEVATLQRQETRLQLLAIADELGDGANV